MLNIPAGSLRQPWFKKTRAAALGFGLGATLALSPLVAAQTPPSGVEPAPVTSPPTAMLPQQSFAPLVKRVLPAVVNISVTEKSRFECRLRINCRNSSAARRLTSFCGASSNSRQRRPVQRAAVSEGPGDEGVKRIALGSGFIIDPSGYIVTNNHVVGEAAKVEVILQDNAKYTGQDHRPRPAHRSGGAEDQGRTSRCPMSPSATAARRRSATGWSRSAIRSASAARSPPGSSRRAAATSIPASSTISCRSTRRSTAAIPGGPTFNLEGQVIGINTAIYSPNGGSVGIGFAVPSNVAKTVVAQIEEHGKVERGWLGVQIQEVTPAIAASLGLQGEHGALVAVVTPDSPGAQSRAQAGRRDPVVQRHRGERIARPAAVGGGDGTRLGALR